MFLFFLLSFLIAWALTVPTSLAQLGYLDQSPVPAGLGNLIGVAPALAAFASAALTGRLKSLAPRIFRFSAPATSYFLALGAPVAWLSGAALLRDYAGAEEIAVSLTMEVATFGAVWLVLAFGEEIGWRGYALPILNARMGFWRAATLLGALWAVWHYPKLLSSPYVDSLAQAAPLLVKFTIQIVLANYVLCWLFLRSNLSVVIAALFHATFNVVATAYPLAGVDLYVTAWVAVSALLIFLFERRIDVREDA